MTALCSAPTGLRSCPNAASTPEGMCEWHGRPVPPAQPARARFYAGAPEPSWLTGLGLLGTPELADGLALFVSFARLSRLADPADWFRETRQDRLYDGLPVIPWALDSGAYMEVTRHGRWRISAAEYAESVAWIDNGVGGMEWAAPQDKMCEREALAATGETVDQHQGWTVDNYVELVELWPSLSYRPCPFVPVVQGRTPAERARCVRMYAAAGVDLTDGRLVGVGSVCRLQSTPAIVEAARGLAELGIIRTHYFGMKREGLRQVAGAGLPIASADSMAWSLDALHAPALPGHSHQHCVSCPDYMRAWWAETVRQLVDVEQCAGVTPAAEQLSLWSA
jgi:hypothetical protein